MSVYVELVIFNNLAVDLFISLSTLVIRRKRIGKFRLACCSILGAIVATAYAVVPKFGQILIKILLAPILCLILAKCDGENVKVKIVDYVKTLCCFCLITYFTGGIVYGLSFALGMDIKTYATLGIVALACTSVIVCSLLIAKKKSASGKAVVGVTITLDGESVLLKGLCDSGNLLTDDASGLPVMILSKSACQKIGKTQIEGFATVMTVAGEKCMPVVKFDSVKVGNVPKNALGAMSDSVFGDYDVILQNSMF